MFLAAILSTCLQGAPPPAETPKPPPKIPPVALVGGIVHTMAGTGPDAAAGQPATVLIQTTRIVAVGPNVEIPADAVKIDVTGKHVIPGLIDAMVNHDADHDRLYVAAGVTLVRDTGNELARILMERDKAGKSGLRERGPGPAILSCGGVLDGVPPSTTAAIVLDTPEKAEENLGRLFDLDLDFLSFHSGLSEPVWRKVIQLGHGKKLQVWGPKLPGVDVAGLAASGQDGIYHLEAFLPELPNGKGTKGWADVSFDELKPAIEAFSGAKAAKKPMVAPTLDVFARRVIEPPEHPPELAYLSPLYVQAWITDAGMRGKLMMEDKTFKAKGLRVVETQGKLVRALYERGVTIVPGSAAPNPWILPGDGLIDELTMLARAGIPKPAVLALATSGAARALGVDADRGTIEAGRIADLVVTDADPTADLAALHAPFLVLLRGRILERSELDRLKKDLSDAQKRVQAEAFKPLAIPDPPIPAGSDGPGGKVDVLLRGVVETRALSQRIRGESYAAVRLADGSLVLCSRTLTPGSASAPGNDVELSETIQGGALVAFEVKIKTAGRLVEVRGTYAGGCLNVEYRVDGGLLQNTPVRDRLAFVDTGSVTSEIAMGQMPAEGKFKMLYFDDLNPAIGNWEMHVDKQKNLLARTHAGTDLRARFGADGAIEEVQRQEGSTVTTTRPVSSQSSLGGLPVTEKKTEPKK
jgi:hypothetical protein